MKKTITIIGILILALAILCLSMVACSMPPTNDVIDEATISQESILPGGMEVGEMENHGVKLMSAKIAPAAYADYGISPAAETAFTIKASVSPVTAVNQGIDWKLSFDNPNSTWARGKDVNDYVYMSASADTKSNNISCLQAFGNSIIVTARAQDNPDIYATCRLEYSQKVTTVTLNIGNVKVNLGGNTEVKYEVSEANGPGGVISAEITTNPVYTIAENYTKSVTFSLPSDTEQWFHVKDLSPAGIELTQGISTNKNWYGSEYYFDYNHDIKDWVIFQRTEDIVFKDLSIAEIIDYFSNITCNKLGVINFKLTGVYNSYEFSSQLICIGYTNNPPVNQVNITPTDYLF